jgi:hypothetical protein
VKNPNINVKKSSKGKDLSREMDTDRPGREKSPSSTSSSSKRMVTRSILEPKSTLVDVVSPVMSILFPIYRTVMSILEEV